MAARKMSPYRSPLTLNEMKATAALISSEDGAAILIRGRRSLSSLPNAYDDRPISEAGWAKSKDKLPGAWFPEVTNAETPEKAARMEARRLSRKFKAVVNAALAEAVAAKELEAPRGWDSVETSIESGEDYGWDCSEPLTFGWDEFDHAMFEMAETAEYFGQPT